MTTLDDLKAAAQAATPGEWVLNSLGWSQSDTVCKTGGRQYWLMSMEGDDGDGIGLMAFSSCQCGSDECPEFTDISAQNFRDAEYIALANPETILALIARLEAAERVVECARAEDYGEMPMEFYDLLAVYDALGGRE